MKQSFLNSLKSVPVDTAVTMVKLAGYDAWIVEDCNGITSDAYSNTVILWQDNRIVICATAGNPLELENS